ncbi:MAG: T9SS type A sorting domain-containing protein [Bacteroidetes bacterium]|nr:T9SS type A sorting domain-containing protein [Bacteroidota bacterium]MBU1718526.1 T9SS type A sorting domain-containing protein [Bacteroidota bacterium]
MRIRIPVFALLSLMCTLSVGQSVDWLKKIKGNAYGNNLAIKVLDNGDVLAAGYFEDTVYFDNQTLTANGREFFLARYSSSGTILSKKSIEIPSLPQIIPQISYIDVHGNVYFAGTFQNTLHIHLITLISIGQSDVFIEKLDSSGNFLWVKQFGSIESDDIWPFFVDDNDNIYFASPPYVMQGDTTRTPVRKLDENGNIVWEILLCSNQGWIGASGFGVDSASNVYLTGAFTDTMMVSDNISTDTLSTDMYGDVFTMKINNLGVIQWVNPSDHTTPAGFDFFCYPEYICTDDSGNSYIIGTFEGTIDFDGFVLESDNPLYYSHDYFLAKYNHSGTVDWAERIGSYSSGEISGLSTDNNSLFFTGTFYYDIRFDGVDYLSVGSENMYLAKYCTITGDKIWIDHIEGEAEEARLSVNENGDAFLIGPAYDTSLSFANSSFISHFDFNNPWDALFVVKYSDKPGSISERQGTNAPLQLYPNPSSQFVTIAFDNPQNTAWNVALYDISGRQILRSFEISTGQFSISTANLPAGVYFIKLYCEKGEVRVGKVLVE